MTVVYIHIVVQATTPPTDRNITHPPTDYQRLHSSGPIHDSFISECATINSAGICELGPCESGYVFVNSTQTCEGMMFRYG